MPAVAPHQLLTIQLGDPLDAWVSAGFAVTHQSDDTGRVRLGNTTVVLTGTGAGFEGWALDGVDAAVDGVPVAAPVATEGSSTIHPNGVVRLDHVVLATGNGPRTIAALGDAGLVVRGERRGQAFGAPVHQTFLWAGDVIVEVVAPDGPDPDDQPATVFGLAVVAVDLDATCDRLGDRIGAPRDAVQPGRKVATLRHRDLGLGVPVLVMSPHVPTTAHDDSPER